MGFFQNDTNHTKFFRIFQPNMQWLEFFKYSTIIIEINRITYENVLAADLISCQNSDHNT